MNRDYKLDFISQRGFENHVTNTLKQYKETLKSINLERFNSNLIDPIKLLFDKNVFNKSFEEIIKLEIHRQRDKTNSNIIGYFHQNRIKHVNRHFIGIIIYNSTNSFSTFPISSLIHIDFSTISLGI